MALFGMRLVTFILVQQSKFPSITKKQQPNMGLQDALSAVDADKQLYKIIWSENNFNRFYDKIVITAEEHNIARIASLPKTSDRKWELAKCIYNCKSILPGNLT